MTTLGDLTTAGDKELTITVTGDITTAELTTLNGLTTGTVTLDGDVVLTGEHDDVSTALDDIDNSDEINITMTVLQLQKRMFF